MKNLDNKTIQTIYRIARQLAPKYTFGYHSVEDIIQEAVIISLEVLKEKKYDDSLPLENFLFVHLKNRLFNFKRDNYERIYEPCQNCKRFRRGKCKYYASGNFEDCEKYRRWQERNSSKKNLMSPVSIDNVRNTNNEEAGMSKNSYILDEIEQKNLLKYIDENLPISFRRDYIKFKYNLKLPKSKMVSLTNKLKEIVNKYEKNSEG